MQSILQVGMVVFGMLLIILGTWFYVREFRYLIKCEQTDREPFNSDKDLWYFLKKRFKRSLRAVMVMVGVLIFSAGFLLIFAAKTLLF